MTTLQLYLKDKDSSVRVIATDALIGLIEGWCDIDSDSAKLCWDTTRNFVGDAINDASWRVRHGLMKGAYFVLWRVLRTAAYLHQSYRNLACFVVSYRLRCHSSILCKVVLIAGW